MANKRIISEWRMTLTIIGFSILVMLIARDALRTANAELLNEALHTTIIISATGYNEALIIGVPLFGGIFIGALLAWFYKKQHTRRPHEEI